MICAAGGQSPKSLLLHTLYNSKMLQAAPLHFMLADWPASLLTDWLAAERCNTCSADTLQAEGFSALHALV